MPDYKHMINTHFGTGRLIARAHDPYRKRDVRVYFIGEDDVVGVSDGTDAWMCPTVAEPFSVKLRPLIEAIRAGHPLPVAESPEKDKQFLGLDAEQSRPHRERRRAQPPGQQQDTQQPPRGKERRRVIHA